MQSNTNSDTIDLCADRYTADVSELPDDELRRVAARLERDLSGDPYKFASDADLQAAFDRIRDVREETKARDPRRDDPYYASFDSADRYEVTVEKAVIWNLPDDRVTVTIEFKPAGFESWSFTTTTSDADSDSNIGQVVLDAYDLDDPRDAGRLVGETFPLVGDREGEGWGRIDRYSLEHGHPAVRRVNREDDDTAANGGDC